MLVISRDKPDTNDKHARLSQQRDEEEGNGKQILQKGGTHTHSGDFSQCKHPDKTMAAVVGVTQTIVLNRATSIRLKDRLTTTEKETPSTKEISRSV